MSTVLYVLVVVTVALVSVMYGGEKTPSPTRKMSSCLISVPVIAIRTASTKCILDVKDRASGYTVNICGRHLTRSCEAGKHFSKKACGCVKGPDIPYAEHMLNGNIISDIRERPWAVLLASRCPFEETSFRCSASMIGAKWALTAEHCKGGCESTARSWLYGGSNKFWDDMTWATIRAFHYDQPMYGDIMLIETCGWFYRSDTIVPISIMTDGADIRDREDCFMTGFGRQSEDTEPDGYLREAYFTITRRIQVKDSYCGGKGWNVNGVHMPGKCILAVDNSKRVPSCSGDSGGGLVCPTYDSGRVTGYQLLGVLSGHTVVGGKCEAGLGKIYQDNYFTSAPTFLPFIERYTKARTPDRDWERGRSSTRNAGRGKK